MRRISSQRLGISVLLNLLLMNVAAFAQSQSLGEIARENREKKAAEESSTTPPKVITNATLPKNPDAGTSTTDNTSAGASATRQLAEQHEAQERANEQRAAAQWKRRILQQESTVANLRMRVDRLKASIRFHDPNYHGNGSTYDYYAGLNYNRAQAKRLERLAQLQQQFDDQKRKLEDLQEAARHAGMHTTVYDP